VSNWDGGNIKTGGNDQIIQMVETQEIKLKLLKYKWPN
jgi:hypothetical protein